MKTKYRILGFIVITKVVYGVDESRYAKPKPYIDWMLWDILIYRAYTGKALY